MKIKEIIQYGMPIILGLLLELSFLMLNGAQIRFTLVYGLTFSFVLVIMFFYLMFCIANKFSRATLITCISMAMLLTVNQLKIIYMKEPLMVSDISFAKEPGMLLKLIIPNIGMVTSIIIPFIVVLSIFIGLIVLAKKYDYKIESKKNRFIGLAALLISFVVIINPPNFLKNIIFNYVYGVDNYKDYNSYTTNLEYYSLFGLVSGIYGNAHNNSFKEPENYDEEILNIELKDSKNQFENKVVKNEEKPNIILFFAESFFDVSKIEEISFDKEITKNFNELKKEGKLVELLSPSYGGMSENVSFEIFTGGKMNYFNKGYIPFTQLYKLKNSENIPSHIKDLKENGYYTKILFGLDHYKSEVSMKKVGFVEYEEYAASKPMEGYKDEFLIDKVINEFENKEKDKPYFYMVESYENHMPYKLDKYKEYDFEVKETTLNENDKNSLLAYSQAIYNNDNQLKRLYDYIKNYDEPTVLLFFGDHLPYMYRKDGELLLKTLKYFNTESEVENIYRMYNTELLILSNFDYDYSNIPEFMSTDLMLTYLLDNFNLKHSEYYDWCLKYVKEMPGYNSYVKVDKNGKKYKIEEENINLDKVINIKECMQYMLFMKNVK